MVPTGRPCPPAASLPRVSAQAIMLPNMLSWLLMWLSGLVVVWGLARKEARRDALLARGAVWTAHEAFARRFAAAEGGEARRRVDELSEEQVGRKGGQGAVGRQSSW